MQDTVKEPDRETLLSGYVDKLSLARELGRTTRTIDRLTLFEGLPFTKFGAKKLFCRASVLEWLSSRETPTPHPQSKSVRGAR